MGEVQGGQTVADLVSEVLDPLFEIGFTQVPLLVVGRSAFQFAESVQERSPSGFEITESDGARLVGVHQPSFLSSQLGQLLLCP